MKVTLESTTQIAEIANADGTHAPLQARVWEGETDSGIKCFALITRIAIHQDDVARAPEFERELQSQRPPTDISVGRGTGVFPLRMVLP
ncbi:MAG: hypothetical protein ACJ8AK_03140 [Gemmatimonadaceae bacterium]